MWISIRQIRYRGDVDFRINFGGALKRARRMRPGRYVRAVRLCSPSPTCDVKVLHVPARRYMASGHLHASACFNLRCAHCGGVSGLRTCLPGFLHRHRPPHFCVLFPDHDHSNFPIIIIIDKALSSAVGVPPGDPPFRSCLHLM